MSKKILLLTFVAAVLSFIIMLPQFNTKENSREVESREKEKREDFAAARGYEFMMLRDPAINEIPSQIYLLERKFVESFPYRLFKGQSLNWVERGPNNTAGRVKEFGIDVRTGTAPNVTIIVGSCAGGIWKSTNNGDNWIKATTSSQLHSVSAIRQDTRVGKQDIWYAGTGEEKASSSDGGDTKYFGDGVFKSTDNGNSWNLLPATQTANASSSWTSDWQFVWRLALDKNNAAQDVVYAGTTGGVYRTVNGGTAWSKVLPAGTETNVAVAVDVLTADNGTLYVGSSSNGDGNTIKGIRKSIDGGNTFTNITPAAMPDNFGRIILAVAPSDNNVLYFLVQGVTGNNSTPNAGKATGEKCQLWRSADAGATWTNISNVIPASSPTFDDFDTQSGYDMILHVKPDNPNFVIVGGVSLFKIHDVTNDNMTLAEKHIGGYGAAVNGTSNALGDFINQHPDQHWGAFLPGSNNVFYCGNDGGMHITNDITRITNMASFWQTPKRTGMNTTQLYGVSIAPEAGSGYLAGGFQDRGTWMARDNNNPSAWLETGGGDGSINAIAPDALNTVFNSTTNGNIFRYQKSSTASPSVRTTIKPDGSTNLAWANAFILDPNDGNLLYFAGGNNNAANSGIWRNTQACTATETIGWQFLANSEVIGAQVSAIAASTTNSANVLYYGTSNGKLYRMDNANTGNPSRVEVTGVNFPAGYLHGITVDPTNSANVFVVFSNYNTDRLWYSTNSGTSWTSVTGNLSGSAPSARSAKMFYVNNQLFVFVATSTGLYFTNTLSGANTNWQPEGQTVVGNVICTMLDYRSSDNTLVVATFGRGVFETRVTSTANTLTKTLNLPAGWTLASVPFTTSDMTKTGIFPNSVSDIYGYSNGYNAAATLAKGQGYWVKHNTASAQNLSGTAFGDATIPLVNGWNLVGPYDRDITVSAVTTTPQNILTSNFYGYSDGYAVPTTLEAGKGYWIKSNQAGVINVPAGTGKINSFVTASFNKNWSKITITDAVGKVSSLYLTQEQTDGSKFDLPPVPPSGIFDVRWSNNRSLEIGKINQLNVNGAGYPLTIKVEGTDVKVRDNVGGMVLSGMIKNGESIRVANKNLTQFEIEEIDMPVSYELFQNYPNPFNPSTVIRYNLPEKEKVSVKVFDIQGRLVETLVDEVKEAGSYNIKWNAGRYSSGVYVYKLETGKYSAVKKLLLLK